MHNVTQNEYFCWRFYNENTSFKNVAEMKNIRFLQHDTLTTTDKTLEPLTVNSYSSWKRLIWLVSWVAVNCSAEALGHPPVSPGVDREMHLRMDKRVALDKVPWTNSAQAQEKETPMSNLADGVSTDLHLTSVERSSTIYPAYAWQATRGLPA